MNEVRPRPLPAIQLAIDILIRLPPISSVSFGSSFLFFAPSATLPVPPQALPGSGASTLGFTEGGVDEPTDALIRHLVATRLTNPGCVELALDELKQEAWNRLQQEIGAMAPEKLSLVISIIKTMNQKVEATGSLMSPAHFRATDLLEAEPARIKNFIKTVMDSDYQSVAEKAGYESLAHYALVELERALWNQVPLEMRSTNPWMNELLIKDAPKEMSDVIGTSDHPGPLSLAVSARLEQVSSTPPASWIDNEKDRENWPKKIVEWKADWSRFENCIRTFPEKTLFSPIALIRQQQYRAFAFSIGESFSKMRDRGLDNYLYSQLDDILGVCRTGWHERIQQLLSLVDIHKENSLMLQAAQLTRDLRREIILSKALPRALDAMHWGRSLASDVHYQLAAKQAMNQIYCLGYSSQELDLPEVIAKDMQPFLASEAVSLMSQKYTAPAVLQRLQKLFEGSPEESRAQLVEQLVDNYKRSLALGKAPYIESPAPLYALYDQLAAIDFKANTDTYREALQVIKAQLAEYDIQLFITADSLKEECVDRLQKIGLKPVARTKKRVRREEHEEATGSGFSHQELSGFDLSVQYRELWEEHRASPRFSVHADQVEKWLSALLTCDDEAAKALYAQEKADKRDRLVATRDSQIIGYQAKLLQSKIVHHSQLQLFGAALWGSTMHQIAPQNTSVGVLEIAGGILASSYSEVHALESMLIAAVSRDGLKLKAIPSPWNRLPEVILKSISENGLALNYAPFTYRGDATYVLKAMEQNLKAIEFAERLLLQQPAFIKEALEIALTHLPHQPGAYGSLPGALSNHFEIQELIKTEPWLYYGVSQGEYKYELARKNYHYSAVAGMWDAPDWTRMCPEIALRMVRLNPKNLASASDQIRSNKAIVLAAVKQRGNALQYASSLLRADSEVVLAAVQQWGSALQFASAELKKNKVIALAAVREFGLAFILLAPSLKKDSEITLAAITQDGMVLAHVSSLVRNNRDMVLAAVNQNGLCLKFASADIKNNREIVMAAVRQNALAIRYASTALQADKAMIAVASIRLA